MNPDEPRSPLKTIALVDEFDDAIETYVGAHIDAAGGLVISGEEGAALCEAMRGDLDTDLWMAIAPAWKDELLLRLLAERFESIAELRTYLASHGIPCSGHLSGPPR